MVEYEEEVSSLAWHHPYMYSSRVRSLVSCTSGGHRRCWSTCFVYLSHMLGIRKVPSKTSSKACRWIPSSPKNSHNGDWKHGVWLACMNLCPALSSVCLVVHSLWVPLASGLLTMAKGWCEVSFPKANLTCQAICQTSTSPFLSIGLCWPVLQLVVQSMYLDSVSHFLGYDSNGRPFLVFW